MYFHFEDAFSHSSDSKSMEKRNTLFGFYLALCNMNFYMTEKEFCMNLDRTLYMCSSSHFFLSQIWKLTISILINHSTYLKCSVMLSTPLDLASLSNNSKWVFLGSSISWLLDSTRFSYLSKSLGVWACRINQL